MNDKLFKLVVDQIEDDFGVGDLMALHELLEKVPEEYLVAYLSELKAEEYKLS